MDIYDQIVEGIDKFKGNSLSIENYLKSLQGDVRMLRRAYRSYPVHVPYEKESVQDAYLITYLPHYYQLIHKILLEQNLDSLAGKQQLNLVFVGGGPGSEVYGATKYILSHQSSVNAINIDILDINAEVWRYSHNVVQQKLIGLLENHQDVKMGWNAHPFNLISIQDVKSYKSILGKANLVVIQNCINEIDPQYYPELSSTIQSIFSALPNQGSLLMVDLTSSVRSRILIIEKELVQKFGQLHIQSTLGNASPSSLVSINSRPNNIIRQNLLTGADGLIPRKNLKYDYSLISKISTKNRLDRDEIGLSVLYSPLSQISLADIEEIRTRTFIGLDFGTSVTVCSMVYFKGEELKVKSIPIEQKGRRGSISTSPLVPSVMGIYERQFMLGKHAAEMKPYLNEGENLWHSFKNNLGNLENIEYPKSLLRDKGENKVNNAQDALVLYLRLIYKQIVNFLDKEGLPEDIYCTVSVPANYSSKNKAELRKCLSMAGFVMDDSPLVQEPVSALISAFHSQDASLLKNEESNFLIVDLGAGTVDVSILNIKIDTDNINSRLLSVQRRKSTGGDTINQLMVEKIREQYDISQQEEKILFNHCEELKKILCKEVYTDRNVNYELPSNATSTDKRQLPIADLESIQSIEFSFKQFSDVMINYWNGCSLCEGVELTINKALEQAAIDIKDINEVILSGGGARNPYIKNYCSRYFSASKVIIPDDIQEQVARGNALQSFVLHAFGKNIINSIVYDNVYVLTTSGEKLLFKAGEVAPTLDIELDSNCIIDDKITTYWGNGDNQIEFLIPEDKFPHKVFFYVTSDLDLKCELLLNNKLITASEVFKN